MSISRFFLYASFLCLIACGGGGIGGSGTSKESEGTLTVFDNSIDIIADIDAGNLPFEYLEAEVTDITDDLYLEVKSELIADLHITLQRISGGFRLYFEIEFLAPEMLGFGDHTDQLKIYVCDIPNCVGYTGGQIAGSPFTVDVNYTVTGEPRVHRLSPSIGKAGTAGEVSIRGVGFSLLNAPSVKFGTADALSMQVINDTEITAIYPALAVGTYIPSVLDNGAPTAADTTSLELRNEPDFAYAFIPRNSEKSKIVYDPRTTSLTVLTHNTIERYAYSSVGLGSWNLSVEIEDDDNDSIGIIAIAGNGKGLATIAGNPDFGTYLYNPRTGMRMGIPGTSNHWQVMGTSGDGRYVFSNGFNGNPDLIYDSRTGEITSDPAIFGADVGANRALAVDYDGDTIAMDKGGVIHIYQSLVHTGTIAPLLRDDEPNRFGYNVSADGSRLYLVDRVSLNTLSHFDQLRIFDLTAPDGAGSFEQIAGSPFSIPDQICNFLIAPLIAVSPEQKTLFIAGDDGVVVYPIPDE